MMKGFFWCLLMIGQTAIAGWKFDDLTEHGMLWRNHAGRAQFTSMILERSPKGVLLLKFRRYGRVVKEIVFQGTPGIRFLESFNEFQSEAERVDSTVPDLRLAALHLLP